MKTGESMTTVFHGAEIFDGARLHAGAALVVEDGEVAGIVPPDEAPAGPRVRLNGGVLAPGFVDLQVNGGGGVMLNDRPDLAGIRTICEAHGRLGTTGLMPTLITDTPAVTRAAVEGGLAAAEARVPGFLGLHLEGPHLDPRRKGAHDPALIRPMQAEDLELLCDAARRLPALIVTVAPESVTPAQVAALAASGAVVSLGHSDTGEAGAGAMFAAGAGMVTHLFNAMSQLGNREPGLVGAALAADAVCAGLIADGIHVAPTTMRMALAAKPADGIFLVTDAMAVAGTELDRVHAERAADPPAGRAADPRRRHARRRRHRLRRCDPGAGRAGRGDAPSGAADGDRGAGGLPRACRQARATGAGLAGGPRASRQGPDGCGRLAARRFSVTGAASAREEGSGTPAGRARSGRPGGRRSAAARARGPGGTAEPPRSLAKVRRFRDPAFPRAVRPRRCRARACRGIRRGRSGRGARSASGSGGTASTAGPMRALSAAQERTSASAAALVAP